VRPVIYVGTSGWSYVWNPDGLEWYARHSGLNAVELNMSFYSYPRARQVERWSRVGGNLRWAVKVHRSITHLRKLGEGCERAWETFKSRFYPLEREGLLDFYLFQLPPRLVPSPRLLRRVKRFAEELGERMALEPRNVAWLSEDIVGALRDLGVTMVSVDAPEFGWLVRTSGSVYLRMHGRTAWYAHRYSREELRSLAVRALGLRAERLYVFFNNDHDMLDNAREMLALLRSLEESSSD